MKKCPRCFWTGEVDQVNYCPNCGNPLNDFSTQSVPLKSKYKMKWFNFLIYFGLFCGAFFNVVTALNIFTQGFYFSQTNGLVKDAELYYALPSLRTFDILFAVVCILMAIYSIYTRTMLAKYKVNGPAHLYTLYILNAVISIVHNIGFMFIVGEFRGSDFIIDGSAMLNSIPTTIVATIIIVIANYKYFDKRYELFCNH